jgi:hypothetical protein
MGQPLLEEPAGQPPSSISLHLDLVPGMEGQVRDWAFSEVLSSITVVHEYAQKVLAV